MQTWARRYETYMQMQSYSQATISSRRGYLKLFIEWLSEHGHDSPDSITRKVIESYQRYLLTVRTREGQPLSPKSHHSRLVPIRGLFRWLTKQDVIPANPAADIDLPRTTRRLPKAVLTAAEVEKVMEQPDAATPMGLRDRAILEVLYSTGIRRAEVCNLTIPNVDAVRRTIVVRHGKGDKDRVVPIGKRALVGCSSTPMRCEPSFLTMKTKASCSSTRKEGAFAPIP